ncbi:FhaA domain-containing protein [Serinibacter salmoneus]|uniref:Type III secretion system (T3SS) inner membrane Yop/YscD-like protein n=1 Tax=Serinibacter salmoneus TaxID=556530 RepID=A0A2A9D472_9MICO|nr:DUF3662 and FHA domain-containing protein [Serinibacter salmoneus]PFG21126.1 type III secretion system (T3SS) inner membrane Yop/YscD-like protein [Serinibacter salmoneus]
MGVMDRFEKGVERVVSGAFAKAFKSEVKPVEIASAIHRDMDDRAAAFSQGRTVVPNVFEVELGESDYERVEEWGSDALAQEIVSSAADYAREQGYSIVGPLSVQFAAEGELETGRFRVRSSTKRSEGSPEAAASTPGGAAAPAPRAPEPLPVIDIDGARYVLTSDVTVLGRGAEADIVVDDTGVSRRHLELRRTPRGVILTDLGSTNGTFVEGNRITAATLVNGNTVTFGRTRFMFYTGRDAIA